MIAVLLLTCQVQAMAAADKLEQLFADERQALYEFEPVAATSEEHHQFDGRLPSVHPKAQQAWLKRNRDLLSRAQNIDSSGLSHQETISLALFKFMLESRIESLRFREWRLPFNSDSGFFSEALYLAQAHRFKTAEDYRNYLDRLADLPRYFDEQIGNLRIGLREGFTLPAEVLPGTAKVVAATRFERADASPFYTPFKAFPAQIEDEERMQLEAQARRVIEQKVFPAYAKFRRFFADEYSPRARNTLGASELPDGKNYYGYLVRYFTTLPNAQAEDIHQLGLKEVARIRAEMLKVIADAKFEGDFEAFLSFLRSDPQFYAKRPEDLLAQAAYLSKTIDGELPKFFHTLPRTPYTVKPVPEVLAPNYTAGRYNPGPMGAAGEYWVNTYALHTRPFYALPALTLHEAVPGHHLQGALARELEDMPKFRLSIYPHAFGEGWALYGEKLGIEMQGVYRSPYEHFGRLSYEMWRACRLVVDTGIHAKGWSRQQALDYLKSNTALSIHEVTTEIDRYISWPGQALAYKVGEIKIVELRKQAEQTLAEHFDIRNFHHALLANGGVTLPILEQEVARMIAEAKR
jgi:uncharacterized protein (DUF885 family)